MPSGATSITHRDMVHPNERCHMGENGKKVAQMCTTHLGSQLLAKQIRAPSIETDRTKCSRSGNLTRRDTVHSTKRCHMVANSKQAARTCTMHLYSYNLAKQIWVPSNETGQPERAW